MCPAFGCGRNGSAYRYYVSSSLQQGARRPANDESLRRVPAEGIEDVVLERLGRLGRSRSSAAMDWEVAAKLLIRVEVHATSVHLLLVSAALFGRHADVEAEVARLAPRLSPGERIILDREAGDTVRLILPIRVKFRGGRTWVVTPEGSPALAKAKADRALIAGLQNAHRFVGVIEADHASSKVPARSYDRQLCLIAFLAPDIQRAILEGRQPAGFNLEGLVHGSIPLAWADQRAALGFAPA